MVLSIVHIVLVVQIHNQGARAAKNFKSIHRCVIDLGSAI